MVCSPAHIVDPLVFKATFYLAFYCLLFPPSFSLLFCPCFLARVVSSLAYSNLLGTKRGVIGWMAQAWLSVRTRPAGAWLYACRFGVIGLQARGSQVGLG
jgi:hypothetical protein